MLSRPVSRASCPSCSSPFNATLAIRTSTPTGVAARPSYKPVQRRLSSSKASYPPGGRGPSSESATSNTQSASPDEQHEQTSQPPQRKTSHAGRRRSRHASANVNTVNGDEASIKAQHEEFPNVPAVPPTNHLHENDVKLSSFFALHRPMSITTSIPPSTTQHTFASIFTSPAAPKWKPADVIYTLNTAVSALDPASQQQQTLHDSILSQSPSHNPEAQASVNLEDLVKKYRPFHQPPAPIPLGPKLAPQKQKGRHGVTRSLQTLERTAPHLAVETVAPEKKTFTTTLTISESTDRASGTKTYVAEASPIVQTTPPPAKETVPSRRIARQPFLSRMHARSAAQVRELQRRIADTQQTMELREAEGAEARENPGNSVVPQDMDVGEELGVDKEMLLISVKRRRKLKMKKHKYKKLMKRTRILRRREGR